MHVKSAAFMMGRDLKCASYFDRINNQGRAGVAIDVKQQHLLVIMVAEDVRKSEKMPKNRRFLSEKSLT